MNGIKPELGLRSDNEYINAKKKILDCMDAISKLTPTQQEQLARELIESYGMAAVLEQFIRFLNSGGRF